MIISASRRTDIPAFYGDWFLNRLDAGSFWVRNPYARETVTELAFDREDLDCIVFWTKDPAPMLDKLGRLGDIPYYFQYTLNWYGADLEPGLPDIKARIETFRKLSGTIGKHRVIWRYDPIVFTEDCDLNWHYNCFTALCELLAPYTEKVVVSLVDLYPGKNYAGLEKAGFVQPDYWTKLKLLENIADYAINKGGIRIAACAEDMPELKNYGIEPNACIDGDLVERLAGKRMYLQKDKQRKACNCVKAFDVGAYATCMHRCRYCYANDKDPVVKANASLYDPDSPLLCGKLDPDRDTVKRQQAYTHDVEAVPF